MTSVRKNAAHLKAAFSHLELDEFITRNGDNNVDVISDYILQNPHLFNEKRGEFRNAGCSSELNNTLHVKSGDKVLVGEEINAERPEFVIALASLADYFIEHKNAYENDEECEQRGECNLVSVLSHVFDDVRKQTLDFVVSCGNRFSQQSILTFLFFVNNNLCETSAFNRIFNEYKRNSSETPNNYNMKRLIKRRKARDSFDNVLPENFKRFETKLIELCVNVAEDFGNLRYKRRLIREFVPEDKLSMSILTFECEVCFEEYSYNQGFSCRTFNFGPSSSEKSKMNQAEHMFCLSCVRNHAEATLSGAVLHESSLGLRCMSAECENPIPFADIRAYLPRQLRETLEKKLTNQNLCIANLDCLEHCQKCDFAIEIVVSKEIDKVFRCLVCAYEYCRTCQVDWSKHFGKSCKEVEIESSRQLLENHLSEAIIRRCPRCNLQFIKLDNCNMMTCSVCRTTICYICRTPNITYDHFCRHFRDPKYPNYVCSKCEVKKCLLWEDYNTYDEEKKNNILKEAEAQKAMKLRMQQQQE